MVLSGQPQPHSLAWEPLENHPKPFINSRLTGEFEFLYTKTGIFAPLQSLRQYYKQGVFRSKRIFQISCGKLTIWLWHMVVLGPVNDSWLNVSKRNWANLMLVIKHGCTNNSCVILQGEALGNCWKREGNCANQKFRSTQMVW